MADATQFTDKQLKCADCGMSFVHSAQSQAKFAELGFQNEPKRCGPCREAKKKAGGGGNRPQRDGNRSGGGGDRQPREMFTATCSGCGGEAKVPFKPRLDKPVYCSTCFEKER